ncbi:MAG: Carboxylesterase family-domain-containing protein [Linnemannia elongata]|nr:MAG: Carboxylesterase family-domain-containing protein [Linnemannia elongata]
MPTGKTLLLTICFAAAALPFSSTIASPFSPPLHSIKITSSGANVTGLVNNAPAAKDISGIHLLLDNDVDSQTPKNPVILLSKPRPYKDGQSTCTLLGEKLASCSTPGLQRLLNTTPVAASEVKGSNRYWVNNGTGGGAKCTAFDRTTGRTLQLSCSIKLPALCTNSIARTQVGTSNDKSKQIKVRTPKAGTWQGYRDQNQFRFLGIPYAEPPIGKLRFQKPKRLNPRKYGGNNRVNDATEYGFVCTQLPLGINLTSDQWDFFLGAKQSEDCLHLNVFTPSLKDGRSKGLSVMVYVHGGGYTVFGSSTPLFEPGNLVSRGGVVVVSLNYRMSVFGLFENTPAIPRSKAPGNLATRDQIAALQWIRDNIAAFGGDPSQITIFGESAGGWSMRGLLSAPSAFGLYRNVISQSDPIGIPLSNPKFAGEITDLTMQNLGCKSSDLACAQNKTTDDITVAQTKALDVFLRQPKNSWVQTSAIFRPCVDNSLIHADFAELVRTGKYNRKAYIMWGSTRDEAGAFVPQVLPNVIPLADEDTELAKRIHNNRTLGLTRSPYYKTNASDPDTVRDTFGAASTDYYWTCPIQVMSRGVTVQKSKVYTYIMDHGRGSDGALVKGLVEYCTGRVCHGDDNIPTFGSGDALPGVEQTGDDARFSRQVIDRFTTFAKTGNPNPNKKAGSGDFGAAFQNPDVTNVQWPKYDKSNPVFLFDIPNSTVVRNADVAKCNWTAKNIEFDYQVHGPTGKFVPIFP